MLDIADSNAQLFEEPSPIRGILPYEASNGLLTEDVPILYHAAYNGFAPLAARLLNKGWRNKPMKRLRGRPPVGRTTLYLAVHRHDNGPSWSCCSTVVLTCLCETMQVLHRSIMR